jgi:hypothetical protein
LDVSSLTVLIRPGFRHGVSHCGGTFTQQLLPNVGTIFHIRGEGLVRSGLFVKSHMSGYDNLLGAKV